MEKNREKYGKIRKQGSIFMEFMVKQGTFDIRPYLFPIFQKNREGPYSPPIRGGGDPARIFSVVDHNNKDTLIWK